MNEYLRVPVQQKNFNFLNKRIAFATGSGGTVLGSKIIYFNNIKEWKEKYNSRITTDLILLNDTEKLEYGYDAIVTSWVKIYTPKANKKLLEKTKMKNK